MEITHSLCYNIFEITEINCDWGFHMQTKEKELLERIKTLNGIEKLTVKDIEEIIKELNKNALSH